MTIRVTRGIIGWILTKGAAMEIRELLKLLKENGFEELKGRGKGSHKIFKHPDGRQTTVPTSKKTLRVGTLNQILKDTGLK